MPRYLIGYLLVLYQNPIMHEGIHAEGKKNSTGFYPEEQPLLRAEHMYRHEASESERWIFNLDAQVEKKEIKL